MPKVNILVNPHGWTGCGYTVDVEYPETGERYFRAVKPTLAEAMDFARKLLSSFDGWLASVVSR